MQISETHHHLDTALASYAALLRCRGQPPRLPSTVPPRHEKCAAILRTLAMNYALISGGVKWDSNWK